MARKRVLRLTLVFLAGFGVLVLLLGCPLWFLREQFAISDSGSPKLAREWAAQLEPFNDVDAAKASNDQISGQSFSNGEWVFGLSQNSHGSPRTGGTLVVKDSRQGVRVFFGHVCGGPNPTWWGVNFAKPKSLDEFYNTLSKMGFTEQPLPAR
jgi:hypothetical protein